MPEVRAQTYYPQLKLLAVMPDGAGGYRVTVQTSKGETEQLPIDLKAAVRLTRDFSAAVHQLVNFQPMGEGPSR